MLLILRKKARHPLKMIFHGVNMPRRVSQGDPCGQYISNKRFSRKSRGCKSTSVGADLSARGRCSTFQIIFYGSNPISLFEMY